MYNIHTMYIHNIQPGAADMNHSIKLRHGCFVEFAFLEPADDEKADFEVLDVAKDD